MFARFKKFLRTYWTTLLLFVICYLLFLGVVFWETDHVERPYCYLLFVICYLLFVIFGEHKYADPFRESVFLRHVPPIPPQPGAKCAPCRPTVSREHWLRGLFFINILHNWTDFCTDFCNIAPIAARRRCSSFFIFRFFLPLQLSKDRPCNDALLNHTH